MRNCTAGDWSTCVVFSLESCNLYLFGSGVFYIYRSVDYYEYIQTRINYPMHVSPLFSLSQEITHCWSPDLPGSLEAMIMQILSKGKHLVSSLYRAYTFLQRTTRQKYVSIWERNYDWVPAHSFQVTVDSPCQHYFYENTRSLGKGESRGITRRDSWLTGK